MIARVQSIQTGSVNDYATYLVVGLLGAIVSPGITH
jgi:hypothetical protein